MKRLNEESSCVYGIICNNGSIYIGSTNNIKRRSYEHVHSLETGSHDNIILQNYYNKYGENSLEICILEYVQENDLIIREKFWYDYFKLYTNTLNIAKIGKPPRGSWAPFKGVKHSEETLKKLSLAAMNISEEERNKRAKKITGDNNPQFGKPPWENSMISEGTLTDQWCKAQYIYENYFIIGYNFKKYGNGRAYFEKTYGISRGPYYSMIKLFNAGWIPNQDKSWLKFYTEHV